MVDLSPFQAAVDDARKRLNTHSADPRGDFLNHMQSHGFAPPKRGLVIGKIDRIDGPEDKPGKLSAWYIFQEFTGSHDVTIGAGTYGSWKTGETHSYLSTAEHRMETGERLAYHAAREAANLAQAQETEERQIEAAKAAETIYSQASECPTDHPYLTRKGVKPYGGIKLHTDGRIIIPILIDQKLSSLEFIAPDGTKRRLTGGKCKGGYFILKGQGDTAYVAEGYATAASIHEATGATVFIAFNAGNLYEVCATAKQLLPDSLITIAADDDHQTPGNPGKTKANQAAEALAMDMITPPGYVDFNDMHVGSGLDSLRQYLFPHSKKAENSEINSYNSDELSALSNEPKERKNDIPLGMSLSPPGILSDVINYYNATAGNPQPLFAIQSALAVCSTILSRSYISDRENFASLYFLNLGKSGTGKEHSKTVIERILHQSNLGHLINGDGYTSAGAVFSALLNKPRHISIIDEFGRYIEAGRDLKNGSHMQREANTKLMESFSRCNGVLRPQSYSTMTLKKSVADEINNRQIFNPGLTIYGMSTPDTFLNAMNIGAVKDGFINRFIVAISNAERSVRQHKPALAVPERITSWAKAVTDRYGREHTASDQCQPIELVFTEAALALNNAFQLYAIEKANQLEQYGMAELPGRASEMTMRIALICALAEDPMAEVIEVRHLEWANEYIKDRLEDIANLLKRTLSNSDYEKNKKEILIALREAGEDGVLYSKMMKVPPFSQHKQKDLNEILTALRDADLAIDEPCIHGRGRPTKKWIAIS